MDTTKRTIANDIIDIATALAGVVNFESINYSQILTTEHGESINDLLFVQKIKGIYFYTSKYAVHNAVCNLLKPELPTYVVCPGSKNVYKLG